MIEKAPCVNYGGIWTAACFYSSRTRKSAGCWIGCLDDRLHLTGWGPFDSIDKFNAFFYHDIVRQRPADYSLAQYFQCSLAKVHGRIGELYSLMTILVSTISSGKMGGLLGLLIGSMREYCEYLYEIIFQALALLCQIGGRVHELVPWRTGWRCGLPHILYAYRIYTTTQVPQPLLWRIIVICACQAGFFVTVIKKRFIGTFRKLLPSIWPKIWQEIHSFTALWDNK